MTSKEYVSSFPDGSQIAPNILKHAWFAWSTQPVLVWVLSTLIVSWSTITISSGLSMSTSTGIWCLITTSRSTKHLDSITVNMHISLSYDTFHWISWQFSFYDIQWNVSYIEWKFFEIVRLTTCFIQRNSSMWLTLHRIQWHANIFVKTSPCMTL